LGNGAGRLRVKTVWII